MVALGAGCAAVLIVVAVLVPGRRAVQGSVMQEITQDIDHSVSRSDGDALDRARERLRRVSHDDLLGRAVPGMLKVIDALSRTSPDCDARDERSFQRGICLIRRGRYDEALLAFASVPRRRGGAVYRDVAVRLMAHRRERRCRPAGGPGQAAECFRGGAR
ncbi:MAG: hypothetical protein ABI333_18335 [bacterium]